MTNTNLRIYRVSGYYASGRFVTHEVGATDVINARNSALDADNRIIKVTEIIRLS